MTRKEEIRNAIDTIIPILPSENGRTYEQSLMATGFEALVGYLYLIGDTERLEFIFNTALSIDLQQK